MSIRITDFLEANEYFDSDRRNARRAPHEQTWCVCVLCACVALVSCVRVEGGGVSVEVEGAGVRVRVVGGVSVRGRCKGWVMHICQFNLSFLWITTIALKSSFFF